MSALPVFPRALPSVLFKSGPTLILLACLLWVQATPLLAQKGKVAGEGPGLHAEAEHEEHHYPHHTLGLAVTHVHISEGREEGSDRNWLTVPGWSLDYNLIFHPRWAIGLHTDVVLEVFKVENFTNREEEGDIIERSFPIAPALIATWKPSRHWAAMIGPGIEFASGENLWLTRVGAEFSAEFGEKGWEFLALIQYDFRFSAYDTFAVGMGLARAFGQ